MTTEEIRDKIIKYRAKYNLSQGKFAQKCNVTKSTIWNIESGRGSPSKLTEAKIKIVLKEDEEQ